MAVHSISALFDVAVRRLPKRGDAAEVVAKGTGRAVDVLSSAAEVVSPGIGWRPAGGTGWRCLGRLDRRLGWCRRRGRRLGCWGGRRRWGWGWGRCGRGRSRAGQFGLCRRIRSTADPSGARLEACWIRGWRRLDSRPSPRRDKENSDDGPARDRHKTLRRAEERQLGPDIPG